MDYHLKYQKYKNKYIQLKNKLYGNALTRDNATDPSFESPPKPDMNNRSLKKSEYIDDNGYLIIYKKLSDILAENPDILILKLGSNNIQGNARCDGGKCTYYIYDDNNNLIKDKDKDMQTKINKQLMSISKLLLKPKPKTKILLQIDPMTETYYPFDTDSDSDPDPDNITIENILKLFSPSKENRHFIRTFFPLSRDKIIDGQFDDTIINDIIKLLINYEGILVLHNAIASQCYGILKVIIDLRKINNRKTIYSGVANEPSNTDCEFNTSKFSKTDDKIIPLDENY